MGIQINRSVLRHHHLWTLITRTSGQGKGNTKVKRRACKGMADCLPFADLKRFNFVQNRSSFQEEFAKLDTEGNKEIKTASLGYLLEGLKMDMDVDEMESTMNHLDPGRTTSASSLMFAT